MGDGSVALDARSGLPEGLHHLLGQYPRAIWRAHPKFDGLTAYWLDRHAELRDGLEEMRDTAIGAIDRTSDADRTARRLIQSGRFYVDALEIHHQLEEFQYFPALSEQEPKLVAGFSLLEDDHQRLQQELDGVSAEVEGLIRCLQDAHDCREPITRFHARLASLAPLLDRHLQDEEDLVIPIVLAHGGPAV